MFLFEALEYAQFESWMLLKFGSKFAFHEGQLSLEADDVIFQI
jgi:hypothetical protein